MPIPYHAFNVLIPIELWERWKSQAALEHMSAGALLRRQISTYLLMVESGSPVCANGQRCYVPQMHPRLSPADNKERPHHESP